MRPLENLGILVLPFCALTLILGVLFPSARIVADPGQWPLELHILIAILRDVTTEEEERLKKEEIGRQTVEIADRVVEKQMRIVQEIASLLGETTAETKIALTKLKESINSDETR